jgi:cytosine/uracil/thiamine/allantoin permease
LVVAVYKPLADWAPFSWFIGLALAGAIYYVIADKDMRQTDLAEEEAAPGLKA